MRSRNIALGCALAGALGLAALSPATAHAAATANAGSSVAASARTLAALAWPALPGHPPAAAAVSARKRAPALSISTNARTYAYSTLVRLNVRLGRTRPNRRVSIYAAPVGLRRWVWYSGKVTSAGKLHRYFRLTRTTTFTVVFGGDARDAPARASRTLNAVARVANAVSGYYKKTRAGHITYYVFRSRRMLVLRATVSPNKHGECLKPETQQWTTGSGWGDSTAYGCDSLDSGSHDSAPFNLVQAVGARYRIRADYVRSRRDLANLNANGPWLYLMVVK
jgi:hypothetical protein